MELIEMHRPDKDGFISKESLIEIMQVVEKTFEKLITSNIPESFKNMKTQFQEDSKNILRGYYNIGETRFTFSYKLLSGSHHTSSKISKFLVKDLYFYYGFYTPYMSSNLDVYSNEELHQVFKDNIYFLDFLKNMNLFDMTQRQTTSSYEVYFIRTDNFTYSELLSWYEMMFRLTND